MTYISFWAVGCVFQTLEKMTEKVPNIGKLLTAKERKKRKVSNPWKNRIKKLQALENDAVEAKSSMPFRFTAR